VHQRISRKETYSCGGFATDLIKTCLHFSDLLFTTLFSGTAETHINWFWFFAPPF